MNRLWCSGRASAPGVGSRGSDPWWGHSKDSIKIEISFPFQEELVTYTGNAVM